MPLGISAHLTQIDDLSFAQKGVLFIVVPIVCQLALILIFWQFVRGVQTNQERAEHSNEVLSMIEEVKNVASVAFNQSILSTILNNPVFETQAIRFAILTSEKFGQLEELVRDNRRQQEKARILRGLFLSYLDSLDQARRTVGTDVTSNGEVQSSSTKERVRLFLDQVQAAAEAQGLFHSEADRMKSTERARALTRREDLERSIRNTLILLLTNLFASIFIGALLYQLYQDRILARVKVVTANLQNISLNLPLLKRLSGKDEINIIDAAIHDLATALVEQKQETESFLYSVSHDLRTPLVNLHGFTEELQHSVSELNQCIRYPEKDSAGHDRKAMILESEIPKSISYIRAAAGRFSTIINALLGLSRAGRVEYKKEKVEPLPIIMRVVDSLQAMIAKQQAEVKVAPIPAVIGDKAAIEQIFGNLISNALQYLDPTRRGVISIGVESPGGESIGQVVIFVRDNGLGISEIGLEKLFLPFQRFHQNRVQGEGIGLSLVKKMVTKQGGKIWCTSELGVGTTFYVSFPGDGDAEVVRDKVENVAAAESGKSDAVI
jgi:signal transduction histidine kinase